MPVECTEHAAAPEDHPTNSLRQAWPSFDFDNLNLDQLSIGPPIDVDRLLDICGEDLLLVSDVLDTFCVQGRDRVDSLETASQTFDVRQAIFDSVSSFSFERNNVRY